MPRNFIAVDGEGIEDKYVLLAASTGETVTDLKGISTSACFEFLLSLPLPPKRTVVGFFFTYDVNMMLRDIPLHKLKRLWEDKWLYWHGYILEWTPTKSFTVKRESPRQAVTVYDVGGFFQMSFVKALEKWEAAPPEVIHRIRSMKEARDDFSEGMLGDMRKYCLDECEHLVTLCRKLETALATADLTPTLWQGAGSIAGRLLQKHNIKAHRQPDNSWGLEIHDAILHSYFGGRVELFLQGNHRRACAYDVTSAYPYAATLVPTLRGTFTESKSGLPAWGLVHVRWNLEPGAIVTPFPYRHKKAIYWPTVGEGIYHACEVREALKVYPTGIDVIKAWEFTPEYDVAPFAFIQRAFDERARYKRDGNPAEKAIKLGLNALYGKLAQGIGYRGKPPAHRSYLWAGFLTALTRSIMFRLASERPESVIMIATDGIFLTEDPEWPTEEGKLGALTKNLYPTLFTAQPGVYATEDGTVNKTRGFTSSEVTFDVLRDGYDRKGPFFVAHYDARRFQGLGTSLQRTSMEGWRTWPNVRRKLSLYPARKFITDIYDPGEWQEYYQDRQRDTVGGRLGVAIRHHPPSCAGLGMSEPYTPKTPDPSIPGALEFMELQEQPDPGERYAIKE